MPKEKKVDFKIPPVRVPADDCVVYIGRKTKGTVILEQGEPTYPHKEEWVEIIPVSSLRQVISFSSMVEAARGKKRLSERDILSLSPQFQILCEEIAKRLTNWNWTDWDRKPLPKPYQKPDVIAELTDDEVLWLLACTQLETKAERKKD